MKQSYIFGGQTGLTYDQIQKQRDIANELLRANMSTPQNVGEGLSAIGRALAAKAIDKRTSRADEANRKAYEARRGEVFGMLGGQGGAAPYSAPSQPPVSFDPNSPQGVASDTMAALGKSVFTPGDRESFVSAMMPHALRVSEMTGLDPRLVIAQAAQETGWGKSAPNNNFFGIKSHGKGGGANLGTFEYVDGNRVNVNDSFRTYDGMGASADDYARFLMENPRYKEMLSAGDLQGQLDALGRSGYATDPNYSGSVGAIANSIQVPGLSSAPAATSGGGGTNGMPNPAVLMALAEVQGDPYASDSDKAIASLLMQQTVQAMDPMRQMEMEKTQLELDQMRNPQPGFTMLTDEEEAQMGLNPAGVYQRGADGSIKVVQDAPKADGPTSTMQEYEFARSQGYEGTFQQYQADLKKAGASNTTVSVGGDAAPPSDEPLRKKLMEGEGTAWGEYLKAGSTASGMRQDMELLNQVIELAPSGPVTGRLAEMFPGVSDAAGVFQSVVKRVAPSLRVEGSGSQSDIEYNGFLQSLPALSNRPEANRAIAAFLQSKAQVNMDRAAAVSAYQNGEINAVEARKRIAEIDARSIMTPEIEALLGNLDAPATPADSGALAVGTIEDGWEYIGGDPAQPESWREVK